MVALKKILVPRDFSDCGDAAVHYVLDLARRVGAEVHLLFVEILYADAYIPVTVQKAPEEAILEKLLADVNGGLSGEAGPPVRVVCAVKRDVAAAPAIVRYAAGHDVDLVVMGTHGRRGLRRLLMGSAAEEVVRTAPCPVLVARCVEAEPAGPQGQNAILVPVDFSPHARIALRHARALAGLFGARLDLLHVVEEQLYPAFYNPSVVSVYDLVPNIEARAKDELETFFEGTEGPAAAASFHVHHGHAAHEIVDFARERGSMMIVMATHGLKGMEHFLMGSVAEKVVRLAPCPVFTMKGFGLQGEEAPGDTELAEESTS
jgi:nucleotide-binding universal stress UspA family protein